VPKILKTRAICLASKRVRETSKIVTLFTEKYGRLSLLAKGARNPKSKFGAALEIFTLSEIIFYKSEPKSTYTISETALIESFPTLHTVEKYFYANQITELILRATGFEETNLRLYNLLINTLCLLNSLKKKKEANYRSLTGAYFLKSATLLGFKPELKHCVVCRNSKVIGFSIQKGGAICSATKHPQCHPIYGMNHLKSINYLLDKPLIRSVNFSITKPTLDLIHNYLLFHLERVNLYSLKY
jgi:DNA repair protein RecO (recombination protein O)